MGSKIEIVLGIWIIIAPWILGYAGSSAALWNSIVAGAAVAIVGLWGIFGRAGMNGERGERTSISDR